MRLSLTTLLLLTACPSSGPSSAPTIATFTASQSTICDPSTVTLTWSQADAASLSIDNGVGDVSGKTSVEVSVNATKTFTLTATNSLGSVTKSVTVNDAGFPSSFATTEYLLNLAVSADRTKLAFPANSTSTICDGLNCQPVVLWPSSNYVNRGSFLLGSLDDQFQGIGSLSPDGDVTVAETAGTFDAPELLQGLTGFGAMAIGASVSDSRIVVAGWDASEDLAMAEFAGGTWWASDITINNAKVLSPNIFGAGYGPDSTPFIVFESGSTLSVARRAGTTWSIVATMTIPSAAPDSPALAVSPDGKTAIATWGSVSGSTEAAYATTINLSTNTISNYIEVLSPVTIVAQNFYTSVDFSNDAVHASYALSSYDGRAWTGTFDGAHFSNAAAFHPELIFNGTVRVIHDSCDTPRLVANAGVTTTDPTLRIDAIN